MNHVYIQLRSYQDWNIDGTVPGDVCYGFCIYDDDTEDNYMDMSSGEFKKLINNPQAVISLVFRYYMDDYALKIITNNGCYINNQWFKARHTSSTIDKTQISKL